MHPTPQVLIVDDREENLIALEGVLVDCDAELIRAMSGNEALDLMLKRDFALVLLDVQMPGMDGFEVAELMRLNEKTRHLPIVFVSAINIEDKHIFKGYEAGAVDFLPKPINTTILISKVNIFLDLWRRQKKLAEALEVNEKMSELLKQRAEFDSLTGLPNRNFFYDRLQQAILASERSGKIGALLFIDLDRFKWVNDTLGHGAGDDLLIQVGERLQNCVRKSDTVARLGGDEFTIIIRELEDSAVVDEIANKVLELLASSFTLGEEEVEISASIGITLYPTDSSEQEELLKNADTAMYQAKSSGRNAFSYFTPQMSDNAGKKSILESQLTAALDEDALALHFQPKVDQATGLVTGSEVTVSWDRPDAGRVYFDELIQLAAQAEEVQAVSRWILGSVCQQGRQWLDAGLAISKVSVNISPEQLSQTTDLIQILNEVLKTTGLPAENLELEITENMLIERFGIVLEIQEKLEKLKAMGIQLSLDNYGVGYSSLALLKRMPFQALKIDKSLISGVCVDADSRAIVLATVALARELSLAVNAEGVETEEEFIFLKDQGCCELQGSYFSNPLTAAQYTALMKTAKSLPQSS